MTRLAVIIALAGVAAAASQQGPRLLAKGETDLADGRLTYRTTQDSTFLTIEGESKSPHGDPCSFWVVVRGKGCRGFPTAKQSLKDALTIHARTGDSFEACGRRFACPAISDSLDDVDASHTIATQDEVVDGGTSWHVETVAHPGQIEFNCIREGDGGSESARILFYRDGCHGDGATSNGKMIGDLIYKSPCGSMMKLCGQYFTCTCPADAPVDRLEY